MTFSAAYAIPLACLMATAATAHIPVRVIYRDQTSITRQANVSAKGFNLGNTEGRSLLDERLRRAATLVCEGPRVDLPSAVDGAANCRRTALASARRQADVLARAADTAATAVASLAPDPASADR